jgi:hypothetical protein
VCRRPSATQIAALRALDALSAEWKRILGRKLQRRGGDDA